MTLQEERNERLAKTLIKNLQRRHIEGFYCPTGEEAVRKVLCRPEAAIVQFLHRRSYLSVVCGAMYIHQFTFTLALENINPYRMLILVLVEI